MSPNWNFPALAEPSYEGSELSQAELGHFNFRAESKLTKYRNFFFTHFIPKSLLSDFACMPCFLSNFRLVLANFRFRAEVKKVTSRAENPSARALARASSARTHHYQLSTHKGYSDKFFIHFIIIIKNIMMFYICYFMHLQKNWAYFV